MSGSPKRSEPTGPVVPMLMLTELFLPTKGGTAVWFDEVCRRLGDKEVQVVTAQVPGATGHDRNHPNRIRRVQLGRHPWLRPESLQMYWRLFAEGWKASARGQVRVVHAGRGLPEGLVGLVIARARRVPLIVYAHGEEITTWTQPLKARFLREVYRRAQAVVANSRFTLGALEGLGVDPERIHLVFPGVDLARFHPGLAASDLRAQVDCAGGRKLVLSVGRLSRRKGFDRVIEALPGLQRAGIDVAHAIIGIGEEEPHLRALANRLGVADRVFFLGQVAADDLPRWYNAADVFAMPNRDVDGDTEGFGMVYIEAAACGRTSLAGLAGGTGDAVLDGETGLRVEGASSDAVEAALRRLLADDSLRDRLATRALARARQEMGWDRVTAQTRALHGKLGLDAQGATGECV